ncbi:MAG TPA: hypothetical protein GX528_08145 [Firmicutes bacterium]|nr:hypothetical protein [Bacillota bacterium]
MAIITKFNNDCAVPFLSGKKLKAIFLKGLELIPGKKIRKVTAIIIMAQAGASSAVAAEPVMKEFIPPKKADRD